MILLFKPLIIETIIVIVLSFLLLENYFHQLQDKYGFGRAFIFLKSHDILESCVATCKYANECQDKG